MAYKLLITASAKQDLDDIVVYIIRDLDNLPAAAKLLDEAEERYANLEENPFLYEQCRDARLKMSGYRKVVIGRYVMIYRIDKERQIVYVERFFSELQNYADRL
jgi:addiction module RelE/StbE family toxin